MEVVNLTSKRGKRYTETLWFIKDKRNMPTALAISADLTKMLPWIDGDRLNLMASKSSAVFAIVPHRTGLLTLRTNKGYYRINNTDLCATIRAKCMQCGYADVDEFKAWIADGAVYFTPKVK